MDLITLINKYIEFIYKGDYSLNAILTISMLCTEFTKVIKYRSPIEIDILKAIYEKLKLKYKEAL